MRQQPFAAATTSTPSWVRKWMDWVTRLPKSALWLRAVFLLAASSCLDIFTGLQISVFAFYFVPLFVAAFLISASAGIVMAVVAALIRVYTNFIWPNYMTEESAGFVLVPMWNFLVDLVSFLIFTFLFAILREQLNRENHLARCDPLTGAYNLRAFEEAVELEIARSSRHSAPFTLFYLDLDNFKKVNDTLGHEAGDDLLRTIANQLHQETRTMDTVARLGGDEFGVLLPHTNFEGAELLLVRMQNTLHAAMEQNEWPVTASIGALTFENAPESFEVAVREADLLMYRAKNSGKDRYYHRTHEQFLKEENGLTLTPNTTPTGVPLNTLKADPLATKVV